MTKVKVACIECSNVDYITHAWVSVNNLQLDLHYTQICDRCFFIEQCLEILKW